jgi:hypothetical protein
MMKQVVRVAAVLCVLSLACQAVGQIAPGNVVNGKQESDGVLFQMKRGAMKLEVCTPSVIHVLYSPDGTFERHPDPMVVRSA